MNRRNFLTTLFATLVAKVLPKSNVGPSRKILAWKPQQVGMTSCTNGYHLVRHLPFMDHGGWRFWKAGSQEEYNRIWNATPPMCRYANYENPAALVGYATLAIDSRSVLLWDARGTLLKEMLQMTEHMYKVPMIPFHQTHAEFLKLCRDGKMGMSGTFLK